MSPLNNVKKSAWEIIGLIYIDLHCLRHKNNIVMAKYNMESDTAQSGGQL